MPSSVAWIHATSTRSPAWRRGLVIRRTPGSPTPGTPNWFHAIVDGRVGIEIDAPGRDPLIVATLHPGDVVGWSWFVDRQPWQFDVVALDDVRTVAIDVEDLLGACASSEGLRHELTTRLLRVVAPRLHGTRMQLVDVYGSAR